MSVLKGFRSVLTRCLCVVEVGASSGCGQVEKIPKHETCALFPLQKEEDSILKRFRQLGPSEVNDSMILI